MGDLDLRPKPGSLTARVFENINIGLPPTLFFDIEIPLEPFEYDGETEETTVRLDFIEFKVGDWRALPGKNFTFPTNPTLGYIDGSMYLAGAHNPADVTAIRCRALENDLLRAEVDLRFDFTYEGPEELGVVAVSWPVELVVDPSQLDAAFAEARRQGAL